MCLLETSLIILYFFQLELISIDEAAILLNGDAQDPSLIQSKFLFVVFLFTLLQQYIAKMFFSIYDSAAKVKRLYDIANVLASMNIIQKVRYRLLLICLLLNFLYSLPAVKDEQMLRC